MKIKIADGTLSLEFDIYETINKMSDEEKQEIVSAVTWDRVLRQAVDRLVGESRDWAGDDNLLTLEVLSKMEQHLLSGYKWSCLGELDRLAKNITSHEHIYWKMYHDPTYGEYFRKWLRENSIESNFTHSLETYESFRKMVEEKLEAFGNALKDKAES